MALTNVFFHGFSAVATNFGGILPLTMHQRQLRWAPIDTGEIPLNAVINLIHIKGKISKPTVPGGPLTADSVFIGWPLTTSLDAPTYSPHPRPGDGADGVYPWAPGYYAGAIANLNLECDPDGNTHSFDIAQYDPRTNLRWTRAGIFNYTFGVIVHTDNSSSMCWVWCPYTYLLSSGTICYLRMDVWWSLPGGGGGGGFSPSASKSPSTSKSPSASESPSASQSPSSSVSPSVPYSPSSSLSPSSSMSVSASASPSSAPPTTPRPPDDSRPPDCCATPPGPGEPGEPGEPKLPLVTTNWYRGCEGGGTVLEAADIVDGESWIT